ncbi:MAG: hypothetical protein ACK55Z_19195, partial [bacterium]
MIVWSPKLVSSDDRTGARATSFLLLYRGSSPFTHCATSAGNCTSSAGLWPDPGNLTQSGGWPPFRSL